MPGMISYFLLPMHLEFDLWKNDFFPGFVKFEKGGGRMRFRSWHKKESISDFFSLHLANDQEKRYLQQFQRHLLVMIFDMRWRYFKNSPLEDEFRSGPQNRHEESKFQSCIPNIVSILLCRNPHQHDLMKVVLNMDKIPSKPSNPYFEGMLYSWILLFLTVKSDVIYFLNYSLKRVLLRKLRVWCISDR